MHLHSHAVAIACESEVNICEVKPEARNMPAGELQQMQESRERLKCQDMDACHCKSTLFPSKRSLGVFSHSKNRSRFWSKFRSRFQSRSGGAGSGARFFGAGSRAGLEEVLRSKRLHTRFWWKFRSKFRMTLQRCCHTVLCCHADGLVWWHADMVSGWHAGMGHANVLSCCHAEMLQSGQAVALTCWQAPEWDSEQAC